MLSNINYSIGVTLCLVEPVGILGFKAGLGTAFFSVQNVPFFPVLKRERYVLFRSFLEFLATYETQKNGKERKERNILL